MTDREIIKGLIDRDNRVTYQFFYVDCKPLLKAVIKKVFNYSVDYDEMVNLLYDHLMSNDCARLRQFEYKSTVFQWIKIVAIRFFIHIRKSVIENRSSEPLDMQNPTCGLEDTADIIATRMDFETLLDCMGNRRYAEVLRRLVVEDMNPEDYAKEIGVTVGNLYNIKKRAIAALTRIAIKYYNYGS